MKATMENISSIKKRLDIVIPQEKVASDLKTAYATLRKNAQVKGFRPGKVPLSVVERLYKHQVEEEVMNNLINDAYPKALTEQNLQTLGVTVIDKGALTSEADFSFSVTFEVPPSIDPHDYSGMELEKEKVVITEDMIKEQLETIRSAHAQLAAIEEDRPLREGDAAIVNYQGYHNGRPLRTLKNENFPIILGLNRFHEQVESALIGAARGETREIEVTFPDGMANKDLAGKAVIFKVEVVDIKARILPDVDDEFAKDLGTEFSSIEDLNKKIREQLEESETGRVDAKLYDTIRKKLVQSHDFEAPSVLVDYQVERMIERVESSMNRSGLNLESAGIVRGEMAKTYRPSAEEAVKATLILESIADKESLQVEESELMAELGKVAAQIGQNTEAVEKFYRENNMLEPLKQRLREEKTLKFIVEHATLIEVEQKAASTETTQ